MGVTEWPSLKICRKSIFQDHIKMAAIGRALQAYGKPRIATLIKYGKSELTPPSPGEIPQAIGQAASLIKSATTMKWRHCTVKEATLNTLVAVEVLCWFFVGECIGKGSLVAYQV